MPPRIIDGRPQMEKISKPWHEALAEYFLINPTHSLEVVAKHFEVSANWLSIVKNSDIFQDYYQSRRREHFDDISTHMAEAKLSDKLKAVAELALDGMGEKLSRNLETKEMSIDTLASVANSALRNLGFGATAGRAPGSSVTNVQNHNTSVMIFNGDASTLEAARKRLTQMRERLDARDLQEEVNATGELSEPQALDTLTEPTPAAA